MLCRDTQANIKSDNPSATFGEISKVVASMWDGLNEGAKQVSSVRLQQRLSFERKLSQFVFNVFREAKPYDELARPISATYYAT